MRRTGWIPWLLAICLQGLTALQYTPVALQGSGDGECALIINGPGRSSQFDYSLNILRGGNGFGSYNGQHTCITYDAVNAAYLEARKRVQVAQPHGDYKPEDVATVGELLLDVSVNLARTYGLSYEDIEKGLPLIDTSKTLIREVCPPFLSNVECRPGKYRRFDGLCTNLENPTWGATNQPFTRLIGPLYADGMTAPRISVTGNQLPLARVVSRTMHPDEGFHDHAGTVMVIAWGQFIDHDYTLTATPLDPLNRNDPEECCKRPPHLKNPYCNEIPIPEDDYFYRLFNVRCIDFVRGFPAARPGCRLGSRSQFNTLTGVLDANTVYGVTEKFSRKLRSGYGGELRMNPAFREYGLKDLLPLKLDIPDEGCTRPNRSMYCFEAGEIRVNEQLVLTCMHTLMAREHNRVAQGLAQVNPHWDDETLFQEARRINIAEVQHITYNEFLPILLGKEVMEKFGLLLNKDGYWNGYDSSVNPNVIDAFAAAAYRFGHSLLPTAVERWSKAHKFIASKRLSDLIRRPYDLYRAGVFDEYFMGLMNQVAQAMDDSITQEVTNHLFKKIGAKFGMDLVSFNMQRGREFGLPGYMEFRKFCGLPGADTFDELFGSMPNETIKRYSSIFEHPHDVDLWSGGVSERPLPGSMLGPTFACIIATQFSYSRRGDRFWYELPNQPSSFTPEQLQEIRKARLARVICDNTDLIDSIQLYPMVLPDHEINPRVPCRSGVLPSIDFMKWADPHSPIFQQTQHQPFTNNLVDANEIHPTIIKGNLYKEILRSNLYGKHPYASLFTQKPITNIKILPPLILTPKKEIIKLTRAKRNAEELQNSTETTTQNISKEEVQEIGTISPTDQVTQAIIVTEVSGTPSVQTDTRPLNFKPFVITSSDFQNNSNPASINFEEIHDVGKLIEEKLAKISSPELNLNFNKEDRDKAEQNEELEEEEEEVEEASQKEEQNSEDYDEKEEINEDKEDTENTEKDEIKIFVPQKNINKEEEKEDEKQEEKSEPSANNQEETVESAEPPPEIPASFAKHFLEMGAINPEQLTQQTKEQLEQTKENVKINGADYYLPKVEHKPTEDSEEIKARNKYFDDIINYQMEENKRLQQELEYPDLNNEYEKYREHTANEYLQEKIEDFDVSAKPYVINLKGFYPYEDTEDRKEHNHKDDVDVGTDKERQEDNDDYNKEEQEDDKQFEQTKADLQNENEQQDEEAENEELNEEEAEDEEKEEYQEEEEDVDSSSKKYSIVPKSQESERRKFQEQIKQIDEKVEINNDKEVKDKEASASLRQDSLPSGSKTKKRELGEERGEQQDFMADLHKILGKRNALSRLEEVDNPKEYNTYWSLEYKAPNKGNV